MRNPILRSLSVLTALALLGVGTAHAQQKMKFGPMAGVSLGNVYGDSIDADPDFTATNHIGVAAGVFLTMPMGAHFAIEPQLIYVQKGTKFEAAPNPSAGSITAAIGYVQVPLLLKVLFPTAGTSNITPNIFAGPAIGFKATCSEKIEIGALSTSPDCGTGTGELDVKSTEFSVILGAGINIGRIAIQGRYDLGMTEVNNSPTTNNDAKLKSWIFTVGYALPIAGM